MAGQPHTAGPWKWDSGIVPPDGPERYADIYTEGGDTIIASFNDLIPEGQANARLIAAAPELLEALRETWRVLDAAGLLNLSNGVQLGQTVWFVKASDAKAQSDAAIAKATWEGGS